MSCKVTMILCVTLVCPIIESFVLNHYYLKIQQKMLHIHAHEYSEHFFLPWDVQKTESPFLQEINCWKHAGGISIISTNHLMILHNLDMKFFSIWEHCEWKMKKFVLWNCKNSSYFIINIWTSVITWSNSIFFSVWCKVV